MKIESKLALGLYADTSAIDIEASLIRTDGVDILGEPQTLTRPYPPELRAEILALSYPADFSDSARTRALQERITQAHVETCGELLQQSAATPDIIGYSGHLVSLNAADRLYMTLGDAAQVARTLRRPVIDRFAAADLQAGGTGGPVLASYIEAMTRAFDKPLAFVNLGGISALTFVGACGELRSFHVGVGTLLLDKWLKKHADLEMDYDGLCGARGRVDDRLLQRLLKHPYLRQLPPKTLTRDSFNDLLAHVEGSSVADGAATLTAFIAHSIAQAAAFLPTPPRLWVLAGGGMRNPTLVRLIRGALKEPVDLLPQTPFNKNFNATGYAFLAVRSLAGLPITFPETTGVSQPLSGGTCHAVPPL